MYIYITIWITFFSLYSYLKSILYVPTQIYTWVAEFMNQTNKHNLQIELILLDFGNELMVMCSSLYLTIQILSQSYRGQETHGKDIQVTWGLTQQERLT